MLVEVAADAREDLRRRAVSPGPARWRGALDAGLRRLIADPDRKVANLYGMIHPAHDEVYTVRTVFVIDPKKKIRLFITYPQTTGRNFDEILRVIDSLQLTDGHRVATPVNWKPGEDVIIPTSVSDEEAKKKYPQGFRTLKPYLRVVSPPK